MVAKVPSQERIAAARALYEDPKMSIASLATYLGLGLNTFARCRKEWGWPPRLRAKRVRVDAAPITAAALAAAGQNADGQGADGQGADLAALPGSADPAAISDLAALGARLQETILREIARTNELLAKAKPGSAPVERQARALASLVRSLGQVRDMQRSGDDGHTETDAPAELDDLHAELARRVDRLRGEGEAAAAD